MPVLADPIIDATILFEHEGRYHKGVVSGLRVISCHEVNVRDELVIGALDDADPCCLCEACFGPRRLGEAD